MHAASFPALIGHDYAEGPSVGRIRARFRRSAMNSIAAAVNSARRSGPGQVATGLLLGSRNVSEDAGEIVVESILKREDEDCIESQAARLHTEGAVVVGMFRNGNPVLSADDSRMLKRYGGGFANLLLLIRHDGGSPAMNGLLHLFERGQVRHSGRPCEFPFREPDKRLTLLCGIAAIVAIASLGLAWNRAAAEAPQPAAGFELVADRSGPVWAFRWNPHAAALARARSIRVEIADGRNTNSYPLAPEQVAAGSVLYTPANANVVFSLRATDARGRTVREMLFLMDARRPNEPIAAPVQPKQSTPPIHPRV
jgi:hypothetical protein